MITAARPCLPLLLLCAASSAGAACPIHPAHFFVGANATYCTYNDIQTAIDAVGSCPVVIDVTPEHLYGNGGFCTPSQSGGCHLSIGGKSVTLQGWGDGTSCFSLSEAICPDCGPGSTEPLVTLDGNNAGGPVLSISGSSHVQLRNLTLQHGSTYLTGSGGGISFSGTGSLVLGATTVANNYAGYGAGINVNGSGGNAALTLGANSLVIANQAQFSGAGIRLEGEAYLLADQAQTLIGYNQALGHDPITNTDSGGFGGGLEVLGPAQADIGSPGYGAGGVIDNNTARYGGGISANAPDDAHEPTVRLFTTDAARPVRVSNNVASNTGGAIYLAPYVDESGYAVPYLCAVDFRIDGNSAQEGAAIYADSDSSQLQGTWGAVAELNYGLSNAECADPQPFAALGSVACNAGPDCNAISDNIAQTEGGTPTAGSTILAQNASFLDVDRVILRGNSGGHVLRGLDAPTLLHDCLIVENAVSGELLRQENEGEVGESGPGFSDIGNCTISANAIGGGDVIASAHGLVLADSIIDQPGVPVLGYTGNPGYLAVSYLLANDTSTLAGGTGVSAGAPTFVAAAQGDYHLRATSRGIDYAPPIAGDDRDLDGLPHDQDLGPVPNLYGDRDLGAYERQFVCAADTVFCDGFDAYQ